jgi:hypothetical protein
MSDILTRKQWAKRLNGKWLGAIEGMVEAVFDLGRDLLLARKDLAHGEFQRMVKERHL